MGLQDIISCLSLSKYLMVLLHNINIDDTSAIYEYLRQAHENRKVAKTNMNEHSSRSHLIFILRIKGENSVKDIHTEGLLCLVDLAGSERRSKSMVKGKHLKEAVHINKSLSCLIDVFTALKNKHQLHIPYRNSKLTHLLQVNPQPPKL